MSTPLTEHALPRSRIKWGPGTGMFALAVTSVLVSLWLVLLDPVMDADSISRLQQAQDFRAGSGRTTSDAIDTTVLVQLADITGLSHRAAGHLATTLGYVMVCLAFVATTATLGADRRTQFLAALVILLHPLLADYRSGISLAPVYWALILLALRQLLLYTQRPDWPARCKWYACVGLAALLQIEAVVWATLAPLVLLVALPRRQRLGAGLKLLLPLWAIVAILFGTGALHAIAVAQGNPLAPVPGGWLDFADPASQVSGAVASTLPVYAGHPDRGWVEAGGLIGMLAATLVRAVTPACLLLLLLGFLLARPRAPGRLDQRLVNAHILAHTATLLLLLATGTLVSGRAMGEEAVPVVLSVLLYAGFVLDALWRRGRLLWKLPVLVTLAVLAGSGLYNGKYEQEYILQASDWLRQQAIEPGSIISNNPYIAHFAADGAIPVAPEDLSELLAGTAWRDFQYLAIAMDAAGHHQLHQLAIKPTLEVRRVFGGGSRGLVVLLENTRAR